MSDYDDSKWISYHYDKGYEAGKAEAEGRILKLQQESYRLRTHLKRIETCATLNEERAQKAESELQQAREEIKICHIAYDQVQQQLSQSQARLEDVNIKDSAKTREINILVDENKALQRRLDEAVGLLTEALNQLDNLPHLGAIEGPVAFSANKIRAFLSALPLFNPLL